MRVCMFVYNRCTTDARVLKSAAAARAAGHDVEIVAVLDATTTRHEERDGFTITRIERDPIHYRLLRFARRARRKVRLILEPQPARSRLLRITAFFLPKPIRQSFAFRRLRWYARRTRDLLGGAPVGTAGAPEVGQLEEVPEPVAEPARATGRLTERLRHIDEALSAHLYRRLMVLHRPLLFIDWYRRSLRHAVAEGGADVYHANDLLTLPVGWLAARRTGGRLIYDAHELYPEVSTLSPRERRIWATVERRLIGRADAVVTVCDSIATELSHRYGIAQPVVVLNAPEERPQVAGDRSPLREAIAYDGRSEPIVLYQGGFAPHRGLDTLIRAAALLPDTLIVLQGWGPLEPELRRLVAAGGLEERVIFAAPVSPAEVITYAAGADLGVIPYEPVGLNNRYTTPNKLFDYMTAGLPIVASRLPELVRYVEEAGIGLTFEPADADGLATAIRELVEDAPRLSAMRRREADLSPQFTWERESQKLLQLYNPSRRAERAMS